jgi:hypothetical protein
LRTVLSHAGAIRFQLILVTAMIGAASIRYRYDAAFASSTRLTVLVIPAVYVGLRIADR